MKKKRNWVLFFLYLCIAGCAPLAFLTGATTGIVSYKYYQDALTVVYQAPYIETWDGTLRALKAMDLEVVSKRHDLTAGEIKAKRADKKVVFISVKYKSANETEVVIRVGLLGDRGASDAIHQEIKKELFKE